MDADKDQPIAIIGAGSWGTALALQLARGDRIVELWDIDTDHLGKIAEARVNERYLPGTEFPDNLHPEMDLEKCLDDVRDILIVVPSHGFRQTLLRLQPLLADDMRICWATKGFELSTGLLPHQVAEEIVGSDRPMAVLSGPTFAKEVAAGLPTAMTIAANDNQFASDLAEEISGDSFRAYTAKDMIGVEVGGAVKNVLAIAAGLSDGLGFGANTRVALINRGLVEMTRLGLALGAKPATFMGLAGMGDLVLTCTDNLSRNRRMGLALAAGKTIDQAQQEIQQVVEGVLAAKAVRKVAQREGVEMPICLVLHQILYEDLAPREAVTALMGRALKSE
ncbi:MAG: NAD(P)H-dependent glycerol-3-phosphate dehydrogenase [Woeseia sp.]